MARCIMLIRHAEKPGKGASGVDALGTPDARSLSPKGWKRAEALVPYFTTMADNLQQRRISRPLQIFAARASEVHPSTRPVDTMRPLADRAALAIDERWNDGDSVGHIAEHLRGFEEPVLVCWRHESLPALARAILQRDGPPPYWPDDRFDMTWVVRNDGDGWIFLQAPQMLLPGDDIRIIG